MVMMIVDASVYGQKYKIQFRTFSIPLLTLNATIFLDLGRLQIQPRRCCERRESENKVLCDGDRLSRFVMNINKTRMRKKRLFIALTSNRLFGVIKKSFVIRREALIYRGWLTQQLTLICIQMGTSHDLS